MKTTRKESYKIYDQSEAIEKAKELLMKIKKTQPQLKTYRVNAETIIQIKEGKNPDKIISKLKKTNNKTSIIDQIEYGHYA